MMGIIVTEIVWCPDNYLCFDTKPFNLLLDYFCCKYPTVALVVGYQPTMILVYSDMH
jgi:hypothetical protein